MSQVDPGRQDRFITIRKLVALDLVLHGAGLIIGEFTFAVVLCGALSILSLASFLRESVHPLFALALAGYLFGVGLNYVPLLLYALYMARHKSAQQEAAFELEHKNIFARKYSLQSLWLLLIPFASVVLATWQAVRKRC